MTINFPTSLGDKKSGGEFWGIPGVSKYDNKFGSHIKPSYAKLRRRGQITYDKIQGKSHKANKNYEKLQKSFQGSYPPSLVLQISRTNY